MRACIILKSATCQLGLVLLLASFGLAGEGTVRGLVKDPTGAVVPHAIVHLGSQLSGYLVTTVADGQGRYIFNSVPFAQFTLTATAQGFQSSVRTEFLNSNVPLELDLMLAVSGSQQSVVVSERAPLLETGSTTTHHEIEEEEIERRPNTRPQVALSSLLESVPGIIPEENGRLHVRGSEGQVQYVVDGVPIFDNMSGVFSTALDEDDLHSSDIVTGNLPAEFAGRTSAVVSVDTKSGLNAASWNGSLSLFGGSFDSGGTNLEASGNLHQKLGVFLSTQTNRTRRFLDPPEIASQHNAGGAVQLFTRFDFAPSGQNAFHLNLSTNGTDFQVANTEDQEDAGQRQRQERRDDSESLSWTHLFNANTVSEVLAYRRVNIGRLLDPGLTGIPYFVGLHDRTETEGLHVSLSHDGGRHSFKFGLQGHRLGLSENFALAGTGDEVLNDPSNPASLFPIDDPFRFQEKRNGWEVGGFAQDRIRIHHMTVDLGLRLDQYSLLAKNAAASPRVGVAYYLEKTGTVLRASYNRMFQTPPIENLLLASAPQAAVFVPGTHYGPVTPEWQNVYEIGLQQQITKYIRLDLTRYIKNARNFSDDEQFLESGVVFPLTIARGDVRGLEARLDVRAYHGLAGYLSYANSKAIGTTPITGGLPIGSGEQLMPNLKFPGDQDERNEGQFGVTYVRRSGLWATFTGRFDSGVPSEIEPDDAESGEIDPRIAAQLDFERGRIKPRTLLSLAAGYELLRESPHPISLQFGINNLTDRLYLYNFRSIFSGTHVGRPREFTGRITFHFHQH